MSLLVGLRVSGCSPPMLGMTSPMPGVVPAYKLFETWEEAFASSRRAAQGGRHANWCGCKGGPGYRRH